MSEATEQPELTPEEQRHAQRDAWKKAIAKANAIARNGRVRRKPPAIKVGMHRRSPPVR